MKFLTNFLTKLRGKPGILQNREVYTTPNRERPAADIAPGVSEAVPFRPIVSSLSCPYCFSKNFRRRGFRQKKLERVQLLLCGDCRKTFTPQITKGKHYPLATIFDAVSLYNLGYSLEESCRRVNEKQQKIRLSSADFLAKQHSDVVVPDPSTINLPQDQKFVKCQKGVDPGGVEPPLPDLTGLAPHRRGPTSDLLLQINLQPSTLSNWLSEFREMMPFERMRDFMMQKYTPQNSVVTATLAHQQLYRYRFHAAKCSLVMQEHFHHSFFKPLREFLELVPSECPHQFFSAGLRASDAPLTFSKTAMIVRGKTNFATGVAAFVLQSVKERKSRHEALQKFMLYNDSVTVATEVPVYLTRDDLEHMKTQLGFEIYDKKTIDDRKIENSGGRLKIEDRQITENSSTFDPPPSTTILHSPSSTVQINLLSSSNLPKLITGHIDILQIRNGQIHILDYKPNAQKERPIEQLTLYAMALSRLTGLRLFEFKCAWFDEKDYFEFYPLHVLHKPKKARRRRKVETMEGVYNVNKDENRISQIRPILQI